MKKFLLIFKVLCYLSLLVMFLGILSTVITIQSDACTWQGIVAQCESGALKALADFGMIVLIFGTMTTVPALAAIIGLVFLVIDFVEWLRRRNTKSAQAG